MNTRRLAAILTACASFACNADGALTNALGEDPADWVTHDPSRIVEIDGYLMLASTGDAQRGNYNCGLETWYLAPGASEWFPGQCLFAEKPEWVERFLPENDGAYWAPGFLDSRTLYYTVSGGFEADETCIGLAHAEGETPALRWVDSGAPILCIFGSEQSAMPVPAAIDPAVFQDSEGTNWLIFGGGHIYASKLEPDTQQRTSGTSFHIARPEDHLLANGPQIDSSGNPDDDLWVEAAFAYEHDGFVYLFVNWHECCGGSDSTYEIRVGRSTSIRGPFVDADGVSLLEGGGTLVLDGNETEIGPGHAGIFKYLDATNTEHFVLSYHYYTANGEPWATVGMRELSWIDGWPTVSPLPWNPSDYWDAQVTEPTP